MAPVLASRKPQTGHFEQPPWRLVGSGRPSLTQAFALRNAGLRQSLQSRSPRNASRFKGNCPDPKFGNGEL
jgi:hypothetical protein